MPEPEVPNWMLDARRDREATSAIDEALEFLEQRIKEVAAYIKTGQVCQDIQDKQHSLVRITDLIRDAAGIAMKISAHQKQVEHEE